MESVTQDEQARASLVELVKHVYQSVGFLEPLYYSELAVQIGRLNKTRSWSRSRHGSHLGGYGAHAEGSGTRMGSPLSVHRDNAGSEDPGPLGLPTVLFHGPAGRGPDRDPL
jgi:hypothetical protein